MAEAKAVVLMPRPRALHPRRRRNPFQLHTAHHVSMRSNVTATLLVSRQLHTATLVTWQVAHVSGPVSLFRCSVCVCVYGCIHTHTHTEHRKSHVHA
jgi:hypothetical protein